MDDYGLGVEEIPLVGGDMNLVVRIGDTVRRPREPAGVRALLQWYERVDFDGAPRLLGDDERGREILSYVEGEPGHAPVPHGDDVVAAIGRLLRRAHDAQTGFVPPPEPGWYRSLKGLPEVVGHLDLFWTNVVFRAGLPVALIDWELASPTTRTLEVALAATYWAGIRIDSQLDEWGISKEHRGQRLRILCDAYGLDAVQRGSLFAELITYRRGRIAKGAFRGTTPRSVIVANLRWSEAHAAELGTFLA
ncbi:MAG: phosphotransferase [Actinobacteria bacterium]|nr:phosphotransferase [Actinomycetota bacterium]